MEISDEMIERLNEQPYEVCLELCRIVGKIAPRSLDPGFALETVMFLEVAKKNELIDYEAVPPDIEDGIISFELAIDFISGVKKELSVVEARTKALDKHRSIEARFAKGIKKSFGYEFTSGDIERVQVLINELRELLSKEQRLDAGHKERLMKRLEALQQELHKKISTLDSFYVLVGDAGVALGKLGSDAKPLVDRIKELTQIGWKSQARAEQLSGSAENPWLDSESEPPKLS